MFLFQVVMALNYAYFETGLYAKLPNFIICDMLANPTCHESPELAKIVYLQDYESQSAESTVMVD